MKEHREYIISNNIKWKVLSIKEDRYQRVKRGTIDRHLKGEVGNNWLIDYLDYHVTVRGENEDFDRVFVLEEQEANNILFV